MPPLNRRTAHTVSPDRPRLLGWRRFGAAAASASFGVWALSVVTGYELIWAKGHEAIVFSRGVVTYCRSDWESLYCLQRTALLPKTVGSGVAGRSLTSLSFGPATYVTQWPALYPTGFAVNAVSSVPLSETFFEGRRASLWRYRWATWTAAPAAVAPWALGSGVLRVRLAIVRRRLWRRHNQKGCWRCGYPRVGLADASVCPECGAAHV